LIASSPRTGTIEYGAPADQRAVTKSHRDRRIVGGRADVLRQARQIEHRAAAIRSVRRHPARHEPDVEFEHEIARICSAIEPPEQHRRSDRRVPCKRQFRHRRKDADFRAIGLVGRGRYKHGFGQIELARDRLHRGGVEPFRLQHDRERIAGEARAGEHVERDEAAAHGCLKSVGPEKSDSG
jgi:hypothetical protein